MLGAPLLFAVSGCVLFPPDLSVDAPPRIVDTGDGPPTVEVPTNPYDQDGDGYMPPEAEEPFNQEFESPYPFFVPLMDPFGDCLDDPRSDLRDRDDERILPESVFPGASDDWYDGIDRNCLRDNDFDADQDGYMPDEALNADAFDRYVTQWGYAGQVAGWAPPGLDGPAFEDCNDESNQAFPGGFERLGNSLDEDCDGQVDGTSFGAEGQGGVTYSWTGPHQIEAGRVGNRYVLAVAAETAQLETTFSPASTTLSFPVTTARGPAEASSDHVDFNGPFDHDGTYLDATVEAGSMYVATFDRDNQSGTLVISELLDGPTGLARSEGATFAFGDQAFDISNIDLTVDPSGAAFVVACSFQGGAMVGFADLQGLATNSADIIDFGFTNCHLATPLNLVNDVWETDLRLCRSGACEPWAFSSTAFNLSGPFFPYDDVTDFADLEGNYLVTRRDDGTASVSRDGLDITVLPTSEPNVDHGGVNHVDVSVVQDRFYILAIAATSDADPQGRAWLQYGEPTAWTYVPLDFDVSGFQGTSLQSGAVYADGDRVMIAVEGTTPDVVAWTFFAPAL